MATTIPNITEFSGTPPIPQQSQPEFNTNMAAEFVYMNNLPTELNPAINAMNQLGQETELNAAAAENSATAASGAANFAGSWLDATGSQVKGVSYLYNGELWVLVKDVSDITLSEPSALNSDWLKLPSSQQQDANTSAIAINASNISENSQFIQDNLYITPFNNDWNGYLDPEHQQYLPSPNGYPATSAAGGTSYGFEEEICYGIFSNSVSNVVTSDSDGWTFTGGIYKEYELTPQLISNISIDNFLVYLKDESGNEYFLPESNPLVFVTFPTATKVRVAISGNTISQLGITKVSRFFVMYGEGKVVEISPAQLHKILNIPVLLFEGSKSNGETVDWSATGFERSKDFLYMVGYGLRAGGASAVNGELPAIIHNEALNVNLVNGADAGSSPGRADLSVSSIGETSLLVDSLNTTSGTLTFVRLEAYLK